MIAPSVERFGGTPTTISMKNVTKVGGTSGVRSDSTLLNSPNKKQAEPSSVSSLPGTQDVVRGVKGINLTNGYEPRKISSKVIAEFFQKEPSLYEHATFKIAGALYEALQHPPVDDPLALHKFEQKRKNSMPDIQFTSDNEKRLVLNLVFSTLKCKLQYILIS